MSNLVYRQIDYQNSTFLTLFQQNASFRRLNLLSQDMIRIGTTGYEYSDWKGLEYPEQLSESQIIKWYANQFNTLELEMSVYKKGLKNTLNTITQHVDGNFSLILPAPHTFTHQKSLSQFEIDEFIQQIHPISKLNSPFLLKLTFPQSFSHTEMNRKRIATLKSNINIPFIVQFEHPSWNSHAIHKWFYQLNISPALIDSPNFKPVSALEILPRNVYIQFCGRNNRTWFSHNHPREKYTYNYSPKECAQWLPLLKSIHNHSNAMITFKNYPNGYSLKNAKMFHDMLNKFLN